MKHAGDTNEGIVARLEDLGPTRLGALLRAVHEQRMQSRRDVAKRVGASTRMLRHYERGDEPVPGKVLGLLADYYGADLSTRFEARVPAHDDPNPSGAQPDAGPLPSRPADLRGEPAAESSDLGAETLLADLALARLGTLLQSTRVERSDSRRDVASQIGTTARALRRYETGTTPVPHGILTALAEFYGEDLDTRFGHRERGFGRSSSAWSARSKTPRSTPATATRCSARISGSSGELNRESKSR